MEDAFGWRLSREELREIDALLSKHITNPVGPEFMAPRSRWTPSAVGQAAAAAR
jgi:hypothetical protein